MPNKDFFGEEVLPEGSGLGKRQVYFPGRKEGKVTAITLGKARNGCQGKQIYLSGVSCYSCPDTYKRYSYTRKITHPKACAKRGKGTRTVGVTYKWELNGCPRDQFKHDGDCKQCSQSTKREHTLGLDTGYCKRL